MAEEIDILRKYKKYPQFKEQLDKIESYYEGELNLALYENLDKLQQRNIFQVVKHPDHLIIMLYGYRIETDEDVHRLYRLYIRTFDETMRTKPITYSIIFFNTICPSTDAFTTFRSIYRTLPINYYSKLQKIYLVHATWMIKTLDWFKIGKLSKLFSKRIEYIDNLQDLLKYNLPNNILTKIPREIVDYASFKEAGKSQKEKSKDKERDREGTKKEIPIKRRSPFDDLALSIQKYQMCQQKIPRLLKILLLSFKKNPSLLDNEGIFRKSGNIETEEELITELAKKNEKVLDTIDDGFVVAGVIKKIFTHAKEPILPYQFYETVMKANNVTAEKEVPFAQQLLKTLKDLNYRILIYMLSFLKEQVIKRKSVTKMTEYNCAVVFAPCFSRPRNPDFSDLIGTGKMVKFLTILLSRYEQIFGWRAQGWDLCHKTAETPKETKTEQQNRASTDSTKRSSTQEPSKAILNEKHINI